jgi:hypothetical protein
MPIFSIRARIQGDTAWATRSALEGFEEGLARGEADGVRVTGVSVAPSVLEGRIAVEFTVAAPSGHDGWLGSELILREALAPCGCPELRSPWLESAVDIGLGWFPGETWPTEADMNL